MTVRKITGTVLMVFMSLALFAAAGSFPAGAHAAETETAADEAKGEENV